MDYIQGAGIILAIWAVLRNIGNERECQLREMEIRLREQAARNPPPAAVATTDTSEQGPTMPTGTGR
ncbi:MAG: hypothetical protein ACHRHE_15995 [Tepidisphaerales bacterium]